MYKKMTEKRNKHLFIIAAPSGGGKSTICKYLLKNYPLLHFSISATTRAKRQAETDGKEYYFLSADDFKNKIDNKDFIEYEEIFGNFYGTLRTTVNKAILNDEYLLFDIDVKGALVIKAEYPEESVLVFLVPPSVDVLEYRLRNRSTESEEQIQNRLSRAKMELSMKHYFDYIIINENLDITLNTIKELIGNYIPM
jgi:guanylate kinase